MAWRRTDDKPVFEPMVGYFTDAYMSLSLNEWNYMGVNYRPQMLLRNITKFHLPLQKHLLLN